MIYNHNGVQIADFKLNTSNRGFAYGDGFFETIIVREHQVQFLDLHHERILQALDAYGFEGEFTLLSQLDAQIKALLLANGLKDARVKMYFWRESGGLYLPQSNNFSFLIETKPLVSSPLKALKIGISQDWKIVKTKLSGFKPLSASVYVMAAKEAQQKNWDDIILLDPERKIVETARSNVFWIDGSGRFFTPELSLGCVNGIRRKIVLQILEKQNITVHQVRANERELLEAEAIFLTNVSGCFEVLYLDKKKLQHIDFNGLGL